MRRYSIPTILLHWTMAVAIGGSWLIGQVMEDLSRDSRGMAQGTHALLGLIVIALLLPRLLARLVGGVPEATGPDWEKHLATAVHTLLYGLMLVLPLTGLAIAMTGRAPMPVVGLFDLPNLVSAPFLHRALEGVHEVLANVMLGTVALHIAATLWHALVRRDGVMRHMLPGGAR